MAGALVGGAAIGAAFELLFRAVIDGTRQGAGFSSDLTRLKSTLESIRPIVEDIQKLNRILNRPPQETESLINQLKEGEKLVRKCSDVKLNVCKRWDYSRKLNELEGSLLRFFQMDVAVLHYKESKMISVGVSRLEEKVDRMEAMIKANAINGGNSLYGNSEENWISRFGTSSISKSNHSTYRTCAGCYREIGQGRHLICMEAVWHPECFCCHACDRPISDLAEIDSSLLEFSVYNSRPYHISCYKEQHYPQCNIGRNFPQSPYAEPPRFDGMQYNGFPMPSAPPGAFRQP